MILRREGDGEKTNKITWSKENGSGQERDSVDLSESASSADASRNYWERYRKEMGPIILLC